LYNEKNKRKHKGFTKKAYQILYEYDYPGNVRQLKNIVDRAAAVTDPDQTIIDEKKLVLD